jgi:NAD(P)-dependent dehydrogenase (short-subunit alcohol dehydrogenase family)
MKLKNKVAVITGGGRGLGRAAALAMAREGARITIMSRSLSDLNAVRDKIEAAGGKTLIVEGDVSKEDDVTRLASQTTAHFGGIDILLNNAAVIGPARFLEDANPGAWEKTIAINLHGAFYCTHTMVPIMTRQGGGKIISIISGLGQRPYPRFCAYSVSKAGIIQLTRSLSEELKEMNIQVNAIDPGVMDTAMQKEVRALGAETLGSSVYHHFLENKDKGLLKDPAEVAGLAVFLASPEADHLTGHYGTLSDYKRLGWKGAEIL